MPRERRLRRDPRDKSAFRADPAIAEVAARQWGVLSTAELIAIGMTRSSILRRHRRGHLHPLHPGVWAVGHAMPPWEGRMLAAVKACGPTALLSHYSASELFGFVDRLERCPDVTVTTGSHRAPRGIAAHRTGALDRIDRREHLGVPVTSPARALLDLAATVNARRTRAAVRRALGTGKVTVRQLGLVLDRYPGRRGAKTLRTAVASGAAPTRSDGESDVLDIILAAGLAHPDVNRPLVLDGRRVIPDFRWPAQRLVLEVDSRAWHGDPLARADDRERQAFLERHGETVLRVQWTDAVLAPGKLSKRLLSAGAPPAKGVRVATPATDPPFGGVSAG
jgi:very-short-patch-repair endonuclease